MKIFIFRSEKKSDLRAFAADSAGRVLPDQFGPWHAIGVIRPDMAPPHNLSRPAIEQAIEANGFQLWRVKPKAAAA